MGELEVYICQYITYSFNHSFTPITYLLSHWCTLQFTQLSPSPLPPPSLSFSSKPLNYQSHKERQVIEGLILSITHIVILLPPTPSHSHSLNHSHHHFITQSIAHINPSSQHLLILSLSHPIMYLLHHQFSLSFTQLPLPPQIYPLTHLYYYEGISTHICSISPRILTH